MIPFPAGEFGAIVADPPWRYNDSGCQGAAAPQYDGTMTLEQIAALPVAEVAAEQAHLWMWITNPFLVGPEREMLFEIVARWGFEAKGLLTWGKLNPSGVGVSYGTGRWLRSSTEHVIFAVRGNCKLLYAPRSLLLAARGQHSRKPTDFLSIVEMASPGPYVELFARRRRDGWVSWGNELD